MSAGVSSPFALANGEGDREAVERWRRDALRSDHATRLAAYPGFR